MPVEIKELVIRTVVDKGGALPGAEPGGPAAAQARDGGAADIVQECVRQVMRILSKDKER